MKMPEGREKILGFVIVLAIIILAFARPLSFAPQSDISFTIGKVYVKGNKEWVAYPNTVSWTRPRDHDNAMPGVSIATTLAGVEKDREYNMTFGEKQYTVFTYKVYIQVEIKALGGDPTGPRMDAPVEVTVWIKLFSRGEWRLLWVKAENITEISRWTAPRGAPNSNWNVEGGQAHATEPAAINALVPVLEEYQYRLDPGTDVGGGSGDSGGDSGGDGSTTQTQYYYSYDEFWQAGKVDGKILRLKAYLQPPEGWFWDFWSLNYYYTYGESIVFYNISLVVAHAKELLPGNPVLGNLVDEKPGVEGVNEVPSAPWWIWIVVLLVVSFVIWQVARIVVALKEGK